MTIKSLILVEIILVSACCLTPPKFPDQYELGFNESAKLGPLSGNTSGKIYVDMTNNRELITRANGFHDRYCGTVYKLTSTPCNHYIVNNARYLDFPNKKYCCFCCDSSHGCGIVSSDWLIKANATYNGTEQIDSEGPYIKWLIKGLQDNLYYHKNDTDMTPRRLDQVPDDLMDYTSYYIGIKDPDVFQLPSYCTQQCGLTSICAALRGEQNLQSE